MNRGQDGTHFKWSFNGKTMRGSRRGESYSPADTARQPRERLGYGQRRFSLRITRPLLACVRGECATHGPDVGPSAAYAPKPPMPAQACAPAGQGRAALPAPDLSPSLGADAGAPNRVLEPKGAVS
jgi:hypothetical protein